MISEKIVQYQIEQLRAENDLVLGHSNRLAFRIYMNPVFRFVTYHVQNFYWTVTRHIGLGHWHDGSRPDPPTSSRPALESSVPPPLRPRILFDVTQTFIYGGNTGIQRAIREIANSAVVTGEALPVVINKGRFVSYYQHPMLDGAIEVGEGDLLLLFDAAWYKSETYLPLMSATLRKGGRIVLGIHDLIPLHYPGLSKASDAEAFRAWLQSAVPMADAIVTVSRTAAKDICEYLSTSSLRHKPNLDIGWEHLGADFATDSRIAASREIADICDQGPFFLTVGLIEPRKGHVVALSAFEKLWAAGVDARYLIVGGCSESSLAVRQRILRHREYGRRLFWLGKANDADLTYAYRHARSLVYPSCAEGFGLPLVEAARYGVPVIASDIPVFREIGGDSIAYFDLLDADALADRIRDAVAGKTIKPSFAIMTWREATERLLRRVRNGNYQFSLATKSKMSRSAVGTI